MKADDIPGETFPPKEAPGELPPELAEAILHLQMLLPHATRLWQLYREHQKQQEVRAFDRDAAALKADADFSEPSADVAELYTKTYQDGALEPPPGAGWTLYHMAHAVDGLHIIWRRKKPEN